MTSNAANHFLVLTYVALGVLFAISAVRTFAGARGSRRRGATDDALRGELTEIKSRIAAVETMLREVG